MCHQESQRLNMRALPYNFDIVYVPGKQIPMAEALSRNLKHFQRWGGNGGRRPDFFTNSCIQLHYWKLPTASRQICNGPDQGGNFQRCHITIADKSTSEMVGLQVKRNFQRNFTLTGITKMNFSWRMESC